MRYFVYCRKSSEAEDRQVASIESQLTTLKRSFGDRADIEIVHVYEEAFSAKAPGRPQFGEMLTEIERGNADGIIAWAPDRLARNSIDGGRIVYMLDRGVVKDLKFATYTFENNSQGKFMLQIMFGQSKYYSDALSDNVKRGNQSKVERGWRPGNVPLGYRNDPATRTVVRDPERFEHIRSIFELMLSGAHSPREIWVRARDEWELRTPRRRHVGGRLIALSYIYKILTNSFYAGILQWNGRVYPGAHEPVVSLDEFERVQTLLRKRGKPRPKTRHFAFTGVIRCGECGFMVTAEEKVNRFGSQYTYYHCSKRRIDYRCQQRSIADTALEEQIDRFLQEIAVPAGIHEWAIKNINRATDEAKNAKEQRQFALEETQQRTTDALANLISLRVRNLVNDNEFARERRKLEIDQVRVREQLDALERATPRFEPLETLISFRNRAVDWFRSGDDKTKRLIFETVGSNPVLTDRMLSVEAKKPFRLDAKRSSLPQLRASWKDVRTLWINQDPELLGILDNISKLETRLGVTLTPARSAAPRRRRRSGTEEHRV